MRQRSLHLAGVLDLSATPDQGIEMGPVLHLGSHRDTGPNAGVHVGGWWLSVKVPLVATVLWWWPLMPDVELSLSY